MKQVSPDCCPCYSIKTSSEEQCGFVFLRTGCVRMMSCGSHVQGVLLNKWSNTNWLVTNTMYCKIPKINNIGPRPTYSYIERHQKNTQKQKTLFCMALNMYYCITVLHDYDSMETRHIHENHDTKQPNSLEGLCWYQNGHHSDPCQHPWQFLKVDG